MVFLHQKHFGGIHGLPTNIRVILISLHSDIRYISVIGACHPIANTNVILINYVVFKRHHKHLCGVVLLRYRKDACSIIVSVYI